MQVKTEKWVGSKVLVLGNEGPPGLWEGFDFQFTYSAKQFESKANAATVFNAAMDNYFGTVQGLPDTIEYRGYHSTHHLQQFVVQNFDLSQPIAVDVETGGVLGETVTSRTAPMICIAFAQGKYAVALETNPDNNDPFTMDIKLEWLRSLLPKIEKPIFHNGKFDIQVIESNTGVRMPNWFDTMLAHHVLNHAAREHGLKPVCKRYFNAPDWEADIKQWIKGQSKDYSVIPYNVLSRYNCYDVLWTYRLWQKLSVEIESDEQAQMAFYLEMQMAEFLSDVEAVGIPFSGREADSLDAVYSNQAHLASLRLGHITGDGLFNPGSPKQVKEWLEGKLGYPIASTAEESIEIIKAEALNPDVIQFCVYLIEWRKAKKMQGTYLKPWAEASSIEGDSRVHPTFHVHGTTTGRLSSSNPNAQNVPRDKTIRKMVTIEQNNAPKL